MSDTWDKLFAAGQDWVHSLHVSTRAYNCLVDLALMDVEDLRHTFHIRKRTFKSQPHSVEDLANWTAEDFEGLHQCGVKTGLELRNAVQEWLSSRNVREHGKSMQRYYKQFWLADNPSLDDEFTTCFWA